MKKTFENASGYAFLITWRIVRWLPENLAYRFFYLLGRKLVKRNGKSIVRLRANLARVKPEYSQAQMHQLLSQAIDSYLRYWCDTFRFPDWSPERVMSTVRVNNESLLTDAIAAGKGAIVTLPHAGNWDHAGAYFCAKGMRLVTVAERLKPEKLFLKFLAYREAIGMEVLPLGGRVMATLAQRLRKGGLVALVADRDLSNAGIEVEFFGAPAKMPAGPALLAISTGAPLITAYVSYTRDGLLIDFQLVEIPVIGSQEEKVARIVQQCANNFATGISAYPQDWHMLQRIWIDGDFKERVDV
ncbi:MAG: phosphatidylinositol mannoside acyltransferase [Actinobacteria bacterium]|nr:phosphatidylinositol mannoside acyltransferase [Actinomycetota bacterium]